MIAGIARGSHSELGDLFAAWSHDAEHVEPKVGASKFAARLAPFRSQSEACAALIAEGAMVEYVLPLTKGAGAPLTIAAKTGR